MSKSFSAGSQLSGEYASLYKEYSVVWLAILPKRDSSGKVDQQSFTVTFQYNDPILISGNDNASL